MSQPHAPQRNDLARGRRELGPASPKRPAPPPCGSCRCAHASCGASARAPQMHGKHTVNKHTRQDSGQKEAA
eukprot:11763863-Alexandrium_andersonii.AAC.1